MMNYYTRNARDLVANVGEIREYINYILIIYIYIYS